MTHRLATPAGRATYALRKQTVEPAFGIITCVMGSRQFLTHGVDSGQYEWALACLARDLKRMAAVRPQYGKGKGEPCGGPQKFLFCATIKPSAAPWPPSRASNPTGCEMGA
jgi:hypothetical protein